MKASENVFVFDSLKEANDFVLTVGGAQASSLTFLSLSPQEDYPVFEVDAPAFPVRDKVIRPAEKDYSSNLTVYAYENTPYKCLTSPLTLKESTGLEITADQIKAVHSAMGHTFQLNVNNSSVSALPDYNFV